MEKELTYPKEVLEIHQDFANASKELLAEADKVFEQLDVSGVQKSKDLEAFGFTATPEFVRNTNSEKASKMAHELVMLVEKYAIRYPAFKFITDAQVKQICAKYNLIYGDVSRFRGFVPQKNLNEMKAFPGLHPEDSTLLYKLDFEEQTPTFDKVIPNTMFNRAMCSTSGAKHGNSWYLKKNVSKSRLIVAPLNQMDTEGMNVRNYQMENDRPEPKDPIVLQKIIGGFLVITAWGPEASDPLVIQD